MTKKLRAASWAKSFKRSVAAMTRLAAASGARLGALPATASSRKARRSSAVKAPGAWLPGIALGAGGARRYRLYRPPGIARGERLPLVVMLHGCGQDAASFAASTRMNGIAARERFLVLYPEQDRLVNLQGCWNWFDTRNGRAYAEADLIMAAVDQVVLLYPVDRAQVAVAGLSAGASMAVLLAARHPERFQAVVMHSGIPPGTAHSSLTAMGAMHGRRSSQALDATPATMASDWPPLLVIHGDADRVVSPHNGLAAAQQWAQAAGAAAGAVRQVRRGQRYPMEITDYVLRGTTFATHVLVLGLGHSWSGGAASQAYSDPAGPDASRMVWAFAKQQLARQR